MTNIMNREQIITLLEYDHSYRVETAEYLIDTAKELPTIRQALEIARAEIARQRAIIEGFHNGML